MAKVKKFPEIVPVLGEKIKIELVDKLVIDNEELLGNFDSNTYTIQLENMTDEDKRDTTLLHETLHAVLEISGMATVINNKDFEEGLVEVLERVLHKLYKRR